MNGIKQWPLAAPKDANSGKQSASHHFYRNLADGEAEPAHPVFRHEVRRIGESLRVVSINRLTQEETVWLQG